MTATLFTVSRNKLFVGAALICPEAQYFSVTIAGLKTIYRRPVEPETWTVIATETTEGFKRESLPNSSAIARLICNEDPSAYSVQCVAQPLIRSAGSDEVVSHLDKLLRELGRVAVHKTLSPDLYKEA